MITVFRITIIVGPGLAIPVEVKPHPFEAEPKRVKLSTLPWAGRIAHAEVRAMTNNQTADLLRTFPLSIFLPYLVVA